MRLWLVLIHIFLVACSVLLARAYEDVTIMEDDDFAEFEQFEADEDSLGDTKGFMADNNQGRQQRAPPPGQAQEPFDTADEDDMVVEDEDNEFEHFQDPEEFEGFPSPPAGSGEPKITITKVHPIMLRARWDAYWIEALLCCGLAAYALGYAIGRSRNNAIAATFLKLHKPFLDDNFSLVGEKSEQQASSADGTEVWRREAEHYYTLWCSGRTCCEGMLLTLKLIKRQDLVHILAGIVRPSADTLQLKIDLGRDDSDAFVMCVAQKKAASRLAKDMADLSVFCPERRPGDKYGLPGSLQVMSEIAEATAALLDTRVVAALNKFTHLIEYIHISDQYSGVKQMEETNVTKPPETQHVLVVGLLVPCQTEGTEAAVESLRPLLVLTFYLLEKLKRFRLSKEAANKSERNRQRVAEEFVRGTHAARQEQAAARREEKRKQEKERILAEDDPEKQRRWEKKEQKRQLKRKTPKLKQLKVKAL